MATVKLNELLETERLRHQILLKTLLSYFTKQTWIKFYVYIAWYVHCLWLVHFIHYLFLFIYLMLHIFFSQSQFVWEKVENGRGWQPSRQGDVSAGFTVEEDELSWSSSTELADVWFAGSFGRTVEKKKSKTKQLALTRRSRTKTREYVAALLYSISGRPLVCHTGLDAGLFLADFSFSLKEFFCLFSVFSLKAS